MALDRWNPQDKTSMPYWVFRGYNTELKRINMSYIASKKYTYSNLQKEGAAWTDNADKYLYTHNNAMLTLKNWSEAYNLFDNWVRLNNLMALSSYFEIYLSSIIRLAIESDPGTLIGAKHSVDGAVMLKNHKRSIPKKEIESYITSCTKGSWQMRLNAFIRIFGDAPVSYKNNISALEAIRLIRNKVGHAFGRDIRKSRKFDVSRIEPVTRLSEPHFKKFHSLILKITHQIDEMLMGNHIGNYQQLYFYHKLCSQIDASLSIGERTHLMKKSIGKFVGRPYSKSFCREIIEYYDSI